MYLSLDFITHLFLCIQLVDGARVKLTAGSPASYCSTAITTRKANIDYCVNVRAAVYSSDIRQQTYLCH
jgi:hypothetical protein